MEVQADSVRKLLDNRTTRGESPFMRGMTILLALLVGAVYLSQVSQRRVGCTGTVRAAKGWSIRSGLTGPSRVFPG